MVGTIKADLTMVDNADDTTNWTSSNTIAGQTDTYIEGGGAIGITKVTEQITWIKFDYYTENTAYLDVNTSPTHFYIWLSVGNAGGLNYLDSGGIQLFIEDSGNVQYLWNVGGKDTYPGGWRAFVAYSDRDPDETTGGTLTKNAIQYIGLKIDMLAKTTANVPNVWVDALRYGAGLVAYGGSAGTPMDWDDIVSGDNADAYGVIEKSAGAYLLQGPIIFGTGDGTNDHYFNDTSKIIIFKDAPVSTGHYKFEVSGHSSTTTEVILGTKSAGAGIAGCVINAETPLLPFNMYLDGANINKMGLYGCTFINASGTYLSGYSSGAIEALNTIWDSSQEVIAKTTQIKNCTFVNADQRGCRIPAETTHYVTDCNFTNCPTGLHVSGASGTYSITLDNLQFAGCDVDLENSIVSGIVTGQATNGTNASTIYSSQSGYGLIENAVTLYVKTTDAVTTAISGARVRLSKQTDLAEIFTDITDANGEVSQSYNYGGDENIVIDIRKSSGTPKYFPVTTYGTIGTNGFSLTYAMTEDDIA